MLLKCLMDVKNAIILCGTFTNLRRIKFKKAVKLSMVIYSLFETPVGVETAV